MIDLGYRKITDEKTKTLLDEQDQNKDGVLSFAEFVDMMVSMKASDDGKFGTITGSSAKIENKHGGTHTYSLEEVATFARMINQMLKNDEDAKDRVPINPEDGSLFHAFDNGILLCKILIAIDPECIDSRALNR
jgi:DNA gyrase/topoisomerase IV subunit B